MAEAPAEIVDELYGAPFAEFTSRRDAAARELRKQKRREEADAVKALRKPVLSAWAIDQLARSDRDRVDGLLAAGAALRQAKGGDSLRDATHEERDAVEELVQRAAALLRDAGHPVSDKTAGELRDTLHAAAYDEEVRELVAAGTLVEPRAGGGFGFGAAAAASEGKKARRPEGKKRRREGQKAEEDKARSAAREALATAEALVSRREDELEAAQRALDEARAEAERRRAQLKEAGGSSTRRRA